METKDFITKDMFLNLAGCIATVTSMTEVLKILFPHSTVLFMVFLFSSFVAVVRMILCEDYSPDGIILGIINVIPIYLGAIGAYESVLKPIYGVMFGN